MAQDYYEKLSKNKEYKDFFDHLPETKQKKHINFKDKKNELHPIRNSKLISFKDKNGNRIDEQLIIGEVESVKEKEFYKSVEVEVERNLGKFKKFLAYLGIIKSTEKIIKQELHKEEVVSKKERIAGLHHLGDFNNKKGAIKRFLKKYEGFKAYDINDNEIGYIDDKGHFKNKDSVIKCDETILKKNGKIFAVEKDGNFVDLEGKILKDQLIKKGSNIYYLNTAINIKYFDKEKEIRTEKGIKNLNKEPARSALKGSREAAKIGAKLRKEQEEKHFAEINKKPQKAKLTKVGIPIVPTR